MPESALMAKYVYAYKEFDFGFILLSMLHTVPVKMKTEINTQQRAKSWTKTGYTHIQGKNRI